MLAAVRLDEVPDPEHDVGPLRERRRAPGREGRLGRRDGGVDLLDRGEVDLAGEPPGGRVVDRAARGRTCRRPRAPADPVAGPDSVAGRVARGRRPALRPASWRNLIWWVAADGERTDCAVPPRYSVARDEPRPRPGAQDPRPRRAGSAHCGDGRSPAAARWSRRPRRSASCRRSRAVRHTRRRRGSAPSTPSAMSVPGVAAARRRPGRARSGRRAARTSAQAATTEEQGAAVARSGSAARAASTDTTSDERRRASPTPRRPATGCDGSAGASDPHGPGPRYAVAQAASLGCPWPAPPRTIASLPAPRANRSGQHGDVQPASDRGLEQPRRRSRAVRRPPTTASPSSRPPPAGSRIGDAARRRSSRGAGARSRADRR